MGEIYINYRVFMQELNYLQLCLYMIFLLY